MDQKLLKRYIEGSASVEERGQVVRWAKADNENMKELLALRKLYDIMVWQRPVESKIRQSISMRYFMYRIASIAALLLLLLGVGLFVVKRQLPEVAMQTINVPAGQRVELILMDGTSVWLNAGSTFTFPNNFLSKTREVYLDGEGYFKVEKDSKRNFIVKTSSYDVKVLSTEFNVKAYSRYPSFEVSLIKGAVDIYSIDNKEEKISLGPNMRAYLLDGRLAKGSIVNYDDFLWKDGLICFDDELMENVITKLELYFDINIIVENASFKTKKYTGKFRTKDGIEHILKVFQLRDRFIYEKDEGKNLITIKELIY